jgi:hypothetical protein
MAGEARRRHMRRFWIPAALALTLLFSATASQAGNNWFRRQWNNFCLDYQRNNAWPEPFIPNDRAAARAPFAVCVANGWRLQNSLGDQHFESDSATLTDAGNLKVRTILNEAPVAYRALFVVRTERPELTAARVVSVQQAAMKYAQPGEFPNVGEIPLGPRGTPGYYADTVNKSFIESTPEPRIPAGTRSSSSGAASGS